MKRECLRKNQIKAINEASKLSEVEDIYAPFKEKRKTKGTEAIKLGLEPLAKIIMSLPNKTRDEIAKDFINENVKSVDDAITNAGYIIADWISDKPKYRKSIRNYYWYNGLVKGKLKKMLLMKLRHRNLLMILSVR